MQEVTFQPGSLAKDQERLVGSLALKSAETGIKAFVSKIVKALQTKGITLAKVLQIYMIVEKAVKDIEAVLASKS